MSVTESVPATMTVPEAARVLGVSREHAYKAVASGELPSFRIGGKILIPRNRLAEMLACAPQAPAP